MSAPAYHGVNVEPRIPPLENGDRLPRAEFERRYAAMPQVKKAELIEGEVYMGSPVRFEHHAEPHARLMAWLGAYWMATPGVRLGDNATVRLDLDNEPQPDALLCVEPKFGGRMRVTDDDYLEGAPDFVAEVAGSTVSIDLGRKLNVYQRNGVQEYLVWRVDDRQIDWFEWVDGVYAPLVADARGMLESRRFPGLRLAVPALLAGDLAVVLAELQAGPASPAHADFVARLTELQRG
jgi:Uma2 family endonuclease